MYYTLQTFADICRHLQTFADAHSLRNKPIQKYFNLIFYFQNLNLHHHDIKSAFKTDYVMAVWALPFYQFMNGTVE